MRLEPINFKYKKQKDFLLDHVSLHLQSGKLNVLIGSNGAGKTTLLDIIGGLHHVVGFKTPFHQNEIVYQLQGMHIAPFVKGKDLLRLILKSDSPETPFQQLEKVFTDQLLPRENDMMTRLWDMKLGDMSGGERKWLVIRAIAGLDRKLYIFDEPTTGLDPGSRGLIMNILERLAAQENVFVMMSTHILHELAHVNCHMHFLHKGKIAFTGNYQSFLQEYDTQNPDVAFQTFLDMA